MSSKAVFVLIPFFLGAWIVSKTKTSVLRVELFSKQVLKQLFSIFIFWKKQPIFQKEPRDVSEFSKTITVK